PKKKNQNHMHQKLIPQALSMFRKLGSTGTLLMAALLLAAGFANGQDLYKTTVSLQSKNASLKQAFHSIESQTPFSFTYKTNDIAAYSNISYDYTAVPVGKALDEL